MFVSGERVRSVIVLDVIPEIVLLDELHATLLALVLVNDMKVQVAFEDEPLGTHCTVKLCLASDSVGLANVLEKLIVVKLQLEVELELFAVAVGHKYTGVLCPDVLRPRRLVGEASVASLADEPGLAFVHHFDVVLQAILCRKVLVANVAFEAMFLGQMKSEVLAVGE